MRQARRTAVLGALGVLLLFLVLRSGWLDTPFSVLRGVLAPVQRVAARGSEEIVGIARSLLRTGGLAKRVQQLEAEGARLEAALAAAESVARENAELRSALGLLPRTKFSLVVAEVTGVTTDGASASLRVNRGGRDGLLPQAPVIAAEGVVVGRVAAVQYADATVELLTGGNVRVAARSLRTGAEGIVHGVRGLNVLFEGVPKTADLRGGDRLVTTGVDGIFPPHLFLGTVASVRAPENAIFQEATVNLPLDLHRLRVVAVIRPP